MTEPGPERERIELTSERDLFGKVSPRGSWRHRRGEPRVFAFCWTLYLLLSTFVMYRAVGGGSFSLDVYRPALRVLFLVIMAGAVVLWPVVRLSQALPRHIARSVMRDIIIIIVPSQAIIWPQIVLASWSISTVASISALQFVWLLMTGMVLLLAQRRIHLVELSSIVEPDPARSSASSRVMWTLGFLALALTGPVLIAAHATLRPGGTEPWWLWMTSPLTGVHELTRDRPWQGSVVGATAAHWLALGVIGVLAGLAWGVLLCVRSGGAHTRALH